MSGAARRLSFSLLAVAMLVAALLVPGTAAADTSSPPSVTPPAVWPKPQQVSPRDDGFPLPQRVGLVTGAKTDPSAVTAVRKVLTDAGVTTIVTATDDDPTPDAPVVVWVGGPAENSASASALKTLGIAGPSGLPGEGYVLGVGRDSDG
ncbi:MAG: hypothetical protein J2P24_20915, partial [Streptosporangiales bacterium]|nr:hypothetical protein [Streptosporangiales bacterium]